MFNSWTLTTTNTTIMGRNYFNHLVVCSLLLLFSCSRKYEKDITIANFESNSLLDWEIQGFDNSQGQLILSVDSSNQASFQSNYFSTINSSVDGKLRKKITIERDYIRFEIAGGNTENSLHIALLVDNKIVHQRAGNGTLTPELTTWEVSQFKGKEAIIEIIDVCWEEYGIMSHISIDNLVQTNLTQPVGAYVLEDFENRLDMLNWKIDGNAFNLYNNNHPLYYTLTPEGYKGSSFLISFHPIIRDSAVGKMISEDIVLNTDYMEFKIGGGDYAKQTCLNLYVNGVLAYSETGTRSCVLRPVKWDITAFKGQKATIEIVDNSKGGWGHILIDEIEFSNDAFSLVYLLYFVLTLTIPLSFKYVLRSLKLLKLRGIKNRCIEMENSLLENTLYTSKCFNTKEFIKIFDLDAETVDQYYRAKCNLDFTEYINRLRIDLFKEEVIKPESRDLKISAIAENCGFGSRSSFYRIFREFEHTTPSQYVENRI